MRLSALSQLSGTLVALASWCSLLLLGLTACGCMFWIAGCGKARVGVPVGPPVVLDEPELRAGQLAFMNHCHQCHPGGSAGLAPAINNKPLPEGMIKLQVRQGLGAMPAFSEQQIPDEQLDALVSYLKALREQMKG